MPKCIKKYLGELVIAFANMEDSLCEGLAQILGICYDDSKIIFSAVSFKKKTQILNALLRKYDKDYVNDHFNPHVYKLLSKANELEECRNIFMHSDWEYYLQPKIGKKQEVVVLKRIKLKYNQKDQAKVNIEEIGLNEIKKLKAIIRDCNKCASELWEEFGQIGCDIGSFEYNMHRNKTQIKRIAKN